MTELAARGLDPVAAGQPDVERPPFAVDRPGDRYERHQGDVLRLVLWTTISVLLVVVLETASRTTRAMTPT